MPIYALGDLSPRIHPEAFVHPDAVAFPQRWQGRRYWVSATPYPTGNPKYENPSIYQGYTSRQMLPPAGVNNPLAQPGAIGGYLSDPDMLYDPDRNELRMYYRQTAGTSDLLFMMTSQNGVQWSAPQRVFTGMRYELISPAIVRESASSWRMWSVYAVAQGALSIGGFNFGQGGSSVQKNHVAVGRIPKGAYVEQEVAIATRRR